MASVLSSFSIISLRKCTSPLHASIKKLGVNSVIIWTWRRSFAAAGLLDHKLKRELLLLSRLLGEEPTSNVVCERGAWLKATVAHCDLEKKWSQKVTNGHGKQQWHVINRSGLCNFCLAIHSVCLQISLYPHDLKFFCIWVTTKAFSVFLVHFLLLVLRFLFELQGKRLP